ncbi:MAG: glycosyltransferase family protein [Thermoleophilia bacterium]
MVSHRRLSLHNHIVFFFFLVSFLVLAVAGIDHSCLDAADSAYLGASDAIARGLVPYQDFLLAHPPLLFLIGAPLAKIGAGVLPFRIFSILIVAALGVSVWRLAFRVTANSGIAMLAGALTLFAPLGLFFSKLFLNDPLVSLLTVWIFLLLFGRTRSGLAAAGVLSVMATLTKLTWLPVLAVCVVYVLVYRPRQAWIYLLVAVGGSVTAALAVQTLTGGAFLTDILGSQASKGYSFGNFIDGLGRIWEIDWPLIVPSLVGIWFAGRALLQRQRLSPGAKGRLFLLAGWLACGLLLLGTLPAEGHDTNLFLLAEPALAILAAWGIIGLMERGSRPAVALVVVWVLLGVPTLVNRDRDFLFRNNSADVAMMVSEIRKRTTDCQPVFVPACYALEADRPVTLAFYDQFLWEEKYKRGDADAVSMFDDLARELAQKVPPVVILSASQPTRELLAGPLESGYQVDYTSRSWPEEEMWVPRDAQKPG